MFQHLFSSATYIYKEHIFKNLPNLNNGVFKPLLLLGFFPSECSGLGVKTGFTTVNDYFIKS